MYQLCWWEIQMKVSVNYDDSYLCSDSCSSKNLHFGGRKLNGIFSLLSFYHFAGLKSFFAWLAYFLVSQVKQHLFELNTFKWINKSILLRFDDFGMIILKNNKTELSYLLVIYLNNFIKAAVHLTLDYFTSNKLFCNWDKTVGIFFTINYNKL